MLSNETLNKFKEFDELAKACLSKYKEVTEALEKDTDGLLSTCPLINIEVHMYVSRTRKMHEAKNILADCVDKGSIKERWTSGDDVAYDFTIEGCKCMTLLDKEEAFV